MFLEKAVVNGDEFRVFSMLMAVDAKSLYASDFLAAL